MSWKLAELRWRQDVGLNESCWERNAKSGQDDHFEDTKGKGIDQSKHGRSYTGPWCHLVLGKSLAEDSINNRIRPDPVPPILATGLSDSSTTPLLQNTRDTADVLTGHNHPLFTIKRDATRSDLTLNHLQSPCQPTSFQRSTIFCPQLYLAEEARLPLDGNQLSPKDSTTPSGPGDNDRRDQIRKRVTGLLRSLPININADLDSSYRVDFEHARAPSFGLQFSEPEQIVDDRLEEQVLDSGHCSVWRRSQSLSLSLRRASLESTHHSDSALLQNISMDIPTSHSSPEPRTTRPLYPDLPSAYAQIQGRRAASLQPLSSNRSVTRFPLSPSSSSSEEGGYQDLPLDSDNIPLKNLPCRKVHSAHGILHEADHHQESSAMLETSEEICDSNLDWKRASTTLDDIVSQYADASAAGSSTHNDRTDHEKHINPEQLDPVTEGKLAGDAACFGAPKTRLRHVDSAHQIHEFYQQRAKDRITRNPESFGATEEDDEWVRMPESSRSGFLTPSKLRFRLAKRETGDTSGSTLTGRRSPASPWDPLSNATQSKVRTHLQHKGPFSLDQRPLSPDQKPRTDRSSGNRQCFRRRLRPLTTSGHIANTDEQDCRLDSAGARIIKAQHHSQLRPCSLNQIASTHIISQSPSTHSASLLSSRRVDSTLPSSSLLPRFQNSALASSFRSPKAMAASNGTPQAARADFTLTIPSLYADSADSSAEATPNSHLGDPFPRSRIATANNRDLVGQHVEAAGSAVTLDTLTSLFTQDLGLRNNTGKTRVASQDTEALAARRYNEGGYKFNDADISRFLRDSRHLRQRLDDKHGQENSIVFLGQQGFLTTGSSLADVSSNSTALNRLKQARHSSSGSNYSNNSGITRHATRKFTQFLGGTGIGDTGGAGSEYSSLGGVHSSTNSSSRSLMLEELEESFSASNPAISCERCPSFPLAPEVLGVISLENLGRVPFERVQLWDDGEWLEKGWCCVHQRMEYSHAVLVGDEAAISESCRSVQRKAGVILLVLGVATFLLGGWTLIHSMGKGGPLAASAMADLTRWLAGEEGAICCVHPVDALMARAIERAAVSAVVLVVVGMLAVLSWAAATI
ncbi:uncharacterized protein Z519_09550 [Cladophialophora bantiana CBS 173.52]|uniref:Uncharacterized protein n=1 Tax=Cladophialophora bantiana (strain ATCC 10958 / CBS 173.52 / CDC B-1940 / NIH 8579) TaxID=1442370 RepID=A0A0D2HZV3_CLAB1|nr:uncharacterized protein Z519_09550 [Cladophialophora bantiana CBS 173.52]KIW90119.1 hypothetical protein Z519_09550 [Cladophialophora bantiana CBS 173.52]